MLLRLPGLTGCGSIPSVGTEAAARAAGGGIASAVTDDATVAA